MKFTQVLSKEELKSIELGMLGRNDLNSEDPNYYYNSLGFYNLPETLPFVDRLEQLVKSSIEGEIEFQNSYTRIYQNESFLGIHTDRAGLDITISLCIKNNYIEWPLCVSTIRWEGPWDTRIDSTPWRSNFDEVNLREGDMIICEGSIFPHWRNRLTCGTEEKLIYAFYHWKKLLP